MDNPSSTVSNCSISFRRHKEKIKKCKLFFRVFKAKSKNAKFPSVPLVGSLNNRPQQKNWGGIIALFTIFFFLDCPPQYLPIIAPFPFCPVPLLFTQNLPLAAPLQDLYAICHLFSFFFFFFIFFSSVVDTAGVSWPSGLCT